ncbi:MAG: NAD-dependent epimerase/dehydratase family protein [Thermodesulfovibrionales bacterium]|nr:NAD-dependent epimerase/dehydratase family protein [Thermodesulfovibrionales bacterium]
MKILVTGGAGFIGSHVVDSYIAEGYDVVVVDNLVTGKRQNLNPSARFYLMDIRSELLEQVFELERPEIVNHHAAQPSVPASVENPLFDADVNVLGLLNLLKCSVKYGTRKIIFSSSGGAIYGEVEKVPIPEEYIPHPLSPYAITKFVSEQYLNFYRDQYGIDFTVLRYSNIYGPRQVPHAEAGVVAIFMEKLLNGEIPTIYHYEDEPEGMMRDYCYVEDVARANILAIKRGSGETFNIGTGVGTVTTDLYRNIVNLMRDFGYSKESVYDEPLKGPARPGDIRKSCLDTRKAENLLGWSPKYDLKAGLIKTLNWLLGVG